MIGVYAALVTVPAFLPLPDAAAGILGDLVLFAQFAFWGVWWPAVLLSVVLVGRVWCGFFCPEGALSEFASARGRGRAIPRWITWSGWPFTAFVATTVYGQMVSVYQYPRPALLILGGSTLAAVLVGANFGRGKRIWCRYLCPVNGVFGLLAKLSPFHFAVDGDAWRASQAASKRRFAPVDCAPLVPIRTMRGASPCHMCGRCSGFRGAIRLAARSPNKEIVEVAGDSSNPWETALLVYGLIGIAGGAFHWSASPWFVAVKDAAAVWLVDRDLLWPLESSLPWWLLTNYPERHDVLVLLDGFLLLAYVGGTAIILGSSVFGSLILATICLGRWSRRRLHHLAQSLVPIAGCGVFLGLSSLTVTMLRAEGFALGWVDRGRGALLLAASVWSLQLAWLIGRRHAGSAIRRLASLSFMMAAVTIANLPWILLFFGW